MYKDHPFIDSVYIDDEFTYISFDLKNGLNPDDYIGEINDDVERICFNIIAYTNISTSSPCCKLYEIVGLDKNTITHKLLNK